MPDDQGSKNEPESIEKVLFTLCKNHEWIELLELLERNPALGIANITMDNNISTTICHQAITSKGPSIEGTKKEREQLKKKNVDERANVIKFILANTPHAARIKNGYKSLPLHVLCQRNTNITGTDKVELIEKLIDAFPGALLETGGTGSRTPLHIVFTDYVEKSVVKKMIEQGEGACFMKDSKGWLPIHVACSRHGSPAKLGYLLQAYPQSLSALTADEGLTLLDLAITNATSSHPNQTLIEDLKRRNEQKGLSVELSDNGKRKQKEKELEGKAHPKKKKAPPKKASNRTKHSMSTKSAIKAKPAASLKQSRFCQRWSPGAQETGMQHTVPYTMLDPSLRGHNPTYYEGVSVSEDSSMEGAPGNQGDRLGSPDMEPIAFSPHAGDKHEASEDFELDKAAEWMLMLRGKEETNASSNTLPRASSSTLPRASSNTLPRVSTAGDGGDIAAPHSPENLYPEGGAWNEQFQSAHFLPAPYQPALNNSGTIKTEGTLPIVFGNNGAKGDTKTVAV